MERFAKGFLLSILAFAIVTGGVYFGVLLAAKHWNP